MIRRGFLGLLGGLALAPAIIRTPGLLMPVRKWAPLPLMRVRFVDHRNQEVHAIESANAFAVESAVLRAFAWDRALVDIYKIAGTRSLVGEPLMTLSLNGGRGGAVCAGDMLSIRVEPVPVVEFTAA